MRGPFAVSYLVPLFLLLFPFFCFGGVDDDDDGAAAGGEGSVRRQGSGVRCENLDLSCSLAGVGASFCLG